MNELLGLCIPFAQQQLEEQGEFHPFGALLSAEGRAQFAGAAVEVELPDASDLIIRLNTVFRARAQAGEIRASAVCADVRADGGDAIRLDVEHRDGGPMLFLVPYRRRRLRGYWFEPLAASPGTAVVFAQPG
jgi:hypothetical protein